MQKKIRTIEIELCVAKYFNPRANLIVPNISWGMDLHECDLLIVRPSGYGIEVEIKISKSDLIADLKKGHHHHDRMGRISELFFAMPDYLFPYIEYIPEHAGIILISKTEADYTYCCTLRKATINKTHRQFTEKEMAKMGHLAAMRIWTLKHSIAQYQKQT